MQNPDPVLHEPIGDDSDGELLGVAEDENGARVYWFNFAGVHVGFGGDLPGEDQGAPDDGMTTFGDLRRFHRGHMRNDAQSPYH